MNTSSLYVHIPFCDHICGYCAFTKFNYERVISDAFMIRLISQINKLNGPFKTIYVGGGTPTSLEDDQLEGLLQALIEKLDDTFEFTFEGNPENLNDAKVALLKKYGVNRMSLGVQTTDDDLLDKIGRHHKFYDVKKGVDLLRKHEIMNISLDLIYGLPGQSLESFIKSMKDVINLNPDHVSIYALTVEPESLFGRKGIKPVSVELETEMYLSCIELMKSAGFDHYEISNFSKPGRKSEHNQVYWRYENFHALGPGASMKIDEVRKTWTNQLGRYIQEESFDEVITLTKEEQMFEFIMMGLRLREGISFQRFYERFDCDMKSVYSSAIEEAEKEGLLRVNNERIYASDTGFIMLDDILLKFME
ncbi:radical SAM family heme chaperone HemW [Erysipelothrix urinaevulpis]|uniref:radical SAM family heme chaperone HemW n=1 Tax=Erysipelothrix urinaevulpis TaxID=2683717 RepID=UPI0013584EDF|nr:radical SAM family heme chaperone HemW [Erysipelothrix urinaevulpis]